MMSEEHGTITDGEVFEAIQEGEVIESYPDDEPYPSILVLMQNWTREDYSHSVCLFRTG